MRAFASPLRVQAGSPNTCTSPDCGLSNPSAHFSSVVLPVPFFPSRPMTEPGATASETLLSTVFRSNDLETLLRVRTNSLMVTFLESCVDERANVFGREASRPTPFDESPHQADDLVAIGGLPLPDGRQKVPVGQPAGRDLRPNLVEDLSVNRHAGARRDMKPKPPVGWHMCIIVSIHMRTGNRRLGSLGRSNSGVKHPVGALLSELSSGTQDGFPSIRL